MLTISQLASFAGATVRAVRHYHARGLLPEPERDESGYRRYDARAVVDLIRIKTLADAGVPLARVSSLLQAEPAEFAAAIADIDRALRDTIRRTQQHRHKVAQLATGDALALPADVVDYLALLRECGLSERLVTIERDGWILLSALSPDLVADWIRLKREALDDPDFRELYVRFDAAVDWHPDDPRLVELADAMVTYLRNLPANEDPDTPSDAEFDDTVIALLDSHTIQASPGWRRLGELVNEERPFGLTDIRESDAPGH